MELYFRTRDVGVANDYPAIGWMPPLPIGADRLWRRFKDYASAEHPQLVLFQKNGRWELYLEAINSGRTDAATGMGGRIIRMSLYLTGTATESAEVIGLISAYVFETLDSTSGVHTLRELFARLICPGDPRRWKDGGAPMQRDAAAKLLAVFRGIAIPSLPSVAEVGWAGGRNRENLQNFIGSCRAILEGKVSGYALTFPYCRMTDMPAIADLLSADKLVAALSGDSGERTVPIRAIESRCPGPIIDNRKNVLKCCFPVAFVLAVIGLLIWCCVTATRDSKNQEQNHVKKVENSINER